MSTMNWKEPETRAKLLLAVLATSEDTALSGAKAPKIAEYMGCTAKAVTHQLTALRKELAEFKSADGQVAVTPAKKRKTKTSDDEDGGSPAKKTKATPKKRTPKAKKVQQVEEPSDDDEEEIDAAVAARKDRAEGMKDVQNGDDDENGGVEDESE